MEFVCYSDWNQLPDSAALLHEQAARDSIFFSRTWFENLLANATADRQGVLLACVVADGRVLALLPLEMRSNRHWHALTNLYSSLYTLLLAQPAQPAQPAQREVMDCLAGGLSRLPFVALRLDPIADDDGNLRALQQAMEARGIACHRTFRFHNWIHRTRGQSYRDYMAARPARVRNSIARKERKLAREHDCTIRLFTGSGLQQAMADYNAVYHKSWKANELYGDFVDGLVRGFSRQGWLRLAILYADQGPVAAQLWFVAHGKASIFKLVHDENWRRYSPGSILTAHLMKQVIDNDEVAEIDFLTGNDAYKQDWMSERRERWAVHFINRPGSTRKGSRILKWFHR